MNKIFTLLFLGYIGLLLGGCDDSIDFPFQGKDRIQFVHYTTDWRGDRTYSDSLTISLGLKPDSIEIDTAKIVMQILGAPADHDRTYKVVNLPVPDSVKAEPGVHYEALEEFQTFKAGNSTDTLNLIVYRKNLSTSFRNPQTIRIDLKLEATEDFDLGLEGGIRKTIMLNNYLSKPDWWDGNFHKGLGFYHPKKWKILISFNEKFANQHACPFNINNEGRSYLQGMRRYLEDIPTYDDETDERIYLDHLEAPKE